MVVDDRTLTSRVNDRGCLVALLCHEGAKDVVR
jgi:hypothetical protein